MKYTKLDHAILDSTVWREPHPTVRLWITCLAMADWDGKVAAAIPGLADRARITVAECEAGLACLMAPDKFSRTESNEGRRLVKVPGGWKIINFEKYRDETSDEAKRKLDADRARRYRERKRNAPTVTKRTASRDVTHDHVTSRHKDLNIYKGSKALAASCVTQPAEPPPDLSEKARRQLDAFERARAELEQPTSESGSPDETEQREQREQQAPPQ